jgi:single-stranded-DNA-specific exonuclease
MRPWIEPPDVEVPEELGAAVGGHPLVAATLARRGYSDVQRAKAFLDPRFYQPAPPDDLPNLPEAVERIARAVRQGEQICVWGDFDVDGQTATTLLVATLRDIGSTVRYYIPNRETESHGVHLPALKRLIGEGVSLIVTCDTGIKARDAVAFARSQEVDIIITDHHDLPPELPNALAVLNPKMLTPSHPLHTLPGAGCAYKLAEALYARASRLKDAERHLDLLALGIVADVAAQTGDTRYLLQLGLEALRRTERLGLRVMMEMAELNPQWLTEEHIGFVLGPRLNALGRLDDANVAVEFLTTEDLTRARTIATQLESLNARRKLMTDEVLRAAQAQIERDRSLLDGAALVLSAPAWPSGIIGIVASRLVELYGKPTVLIAEPPGGLARGSARSVEGCNITAAIAANSALLASFGGHPMAAGLSMSPERIPEFRRALSRTVRAMIGEAAEKPSLEISGYLSLSDLSLDLTEQLERLAPFGAGNPPLVLATRGLALKSHSPLGREGEHLLSVVEDEQGSSQRVIWWQAEERALPEGSFDLAYTARASDFRGQRSVQVTWVDARPVGEPVAVYEAPKIRVVDHRRAVSPETILRSLRAQPETEVWSEAEARAEFAGRDRHELQPAKALIVWTMPPGPAEMRDVLRTVAPETVYLIARDPGLDKPEAFLKQLGGLVKHAIQASGGRVDISTLAAATAQRESTVWTGIAWLLARGHVAMAGEEGGEIRLTLGDGRAGADLPRIASELRALLEETAAYRAHFTRADAETLVAAGSRETDKSHK